MLNKLPITRIKIFIAKILYKIVICFFGRKNRIIKRNNINYEVDLSEGIDLSLFLFSNFQKHVTQNRFLRLAQDATVIDVGGNFGIMALQFAMEVPQGQVISFEPTHYALAKFRKNLELNPELNRRITVINSFVSSESTSNPDIQAFSSWKVSGEKRTLDQHPVHLGTLKSTDGVGSVTLDEFIVKEQLKRVDLIKIDTDGHEFKVLNGAKECISKFHPIVIFEVGKYVMKERNIDFSFYIDFFGSFDYKLFNSKSGKEISLKNQDKLIPEFGTIDVIALPK